MDTPAIHLVKSNDDDISSIISELLVLYLRLKDEGKDKSFIWTANRNFEDII